MNKHASAGIQAGLDEFDGRREMLQEILIIHIIYIDLVVLI